MRINRKIPALAIPSIVANVTTPLLGLVDTAITGHMGSAVYIGAIAVGGVMFNMLYWLFSFLRGGTSGLAAQACGARDAQEQAVVLWRSLLLALAIGVALVALQRPLQLLLVLFVDPEPETLALAGRYFAILIWGAPAVLANYALSGWFLGMQNPRMLMVTSIVVNVANIALSLALVYGLGWQIAGVATGTLAAQWIGLGVGLWLQHRYRLKRPALKDILRLDQLGRFFRINADMMLRTLCLIAVTVYFTRVGASQGPVMLAVNTLLMQLFLLFSYMMDGFAFAVEALAGRYVGACRWTDLHSAVRQTFVWGMGLSAVFTIFYWVGGTAFLGILTSEADVVSASADYLSWAITVPIAGMAAFVWDGVFIGATLSRQLVAAMVAAMVVFFALVWWLYPLMGNHGLWLAFVAYLLTRGGVQTLLYYRHKWN